MIDDQNPLDDPSVELEDELSVEADEAVDAGEEAEVLEEEPAIVAADEELDSYSEEPFLTGESLFTGATESIFAGASDRDALLGGETLAEGAPTDESISEEPLVLGARASESGLAQRQPSPPPEELTLTAKVEAIVFASPKPMRPVDVVEILQEDVLQVEVEAALDALVELYASRAGGFRLERLKGLGYQFRTVGAAAPIMERQFATRARPLTRAALETLSIIAYRQPVTRAEIEFIRGVDAGSIMKALMDRDLITCVGRKPDSGRPMLFGTTEDFLRVFTLSSLKDLPPLESFQPATELIQAAMSQLDGAGAESVAVEPFVGDSERPVPELADEIDDEGDAAAADSGSGPNLGERLIEGATASFEEDGTLEEEANFDGDDPPTETDDPHTADVIEGARLDSSEESKSDLNGTDATAEMALDPGSGLEEESGELD